jgi:hypothetical protein
MFLSTPLAVMAMAILAEFKGSRWMAVLLSGDGEPYAPRKGGADRGGSVSAFGFKSWLGRGKRSHENDAKLD